MFTTIIPTSDSQLSNKGLAHLVVSDALKKISQLTGLSVQQAFVLLSSPVKATNTTKKQMKNSQVSTPLLA